MGGRLTLSQPPKGFRAGLDSVLLGAAVPASSIRLLDLGAGIGAAALVALALGRAEGAVLAERDAEALALARDNVAGNGWAGRARVIEVDIEARAEDRRQAGLEDNAHDVVIANPPFFAAGQGTPAQGRYRANARHMQAGSLDLWLRCAAASAAAGGQAIVIYPAEGLGEVMAAFAPRFGGLTILPLAPRPGQAATRIIVRGTKGSRAPLTLRATRFLHGASGNDFAGEFDAIFRGRAALDW
ncbi:tRNA1(Val) (adenine(37)-N6)-methyltransferase [Devosia chinhatensis]|uniref:tRNA1(Val) (adenine(37)-N6)-methyltransferase n=1 Tax=Devosia chinhatensis TaxID=429727 RepID=UPI0006973BB7|nr:methyltransferase [Devosia chinhatensis]